MGHEVLEGALATLKYVEASDAMVTRFEQPGLYSMIGLVQAPDLERLDQMIDDIELAVWEICPEGDGNPVGYALYATHDGPPYVNTYLFSEEPDLDLTRECLTLLVHFFFEYTEEPALFFYVSTETAEIVHDELTEGGFDVFEDNPGLSEGEVCYVLERYTYDAYYGEEAGEGELRFRDGY